MTIKKLFYVFCIFAAISCTRQIETNDMRAGSENNGETSFNLPDDSSAESNANEIIDPVQVENSGEAGLNSPADSFVEKHADEIIDTAQAENREKPDFIFQTGLSLEKYIERIIDPIKQFRTLKDVIEVDLGDNARKYFIVILENKNTSINEIYIYLYIFNENDEMSSTALTANSKTFEPDIFMGNVPGRLKDYFIALGDYNGDGINELFVPDFGGSSYSLRICGIEPESKIFTAYCDIYFFVHYPPDCAPIVFIKNGKIDGFKALTAFVLEGMGYPEYPVEGYSNEVGWMFYRWEKSQRKYIAAGEVNPQDEI
jgi:hypothetical protein